MQRGLLASAPFRRAIRLDFRSRPAAARLDRAGPLPRRGAPVHAHDGAFLPRAVDMVEAYTVATMFGHGIAVTREALIVGYRLFFGVSTSWPRPVHGLPPPATAPSGARQPRRPAPPGMAAGGGELARVELLNGCLGIDRLLADRRPAAHAIADLTASRHEFSSSGKPRSPSCGKRAAAGREHLRRRSASRARGRGLAAVRSMAPSSAGPRARPRRAGVRSASCRATSTSAAVGEESRPKPRAT